MNNKGIETMSADEVFREYDCCTLEDFDDYLTYEIMKQYGER